MRRALGLVLGALLIVCGVSACERPTVDECQEACKRVKMLAKADFDQQTDGIPEDVVRQGWIAASAVIEELTRACTTACLDVGDRKLAACLIAAENHDSWKACLAVRK